MNITVKNNGPGIATNIQVNATIPKGLVYNSHNTTKGVYNTNTQIWTIPSLEKDETRILYLNVMATNISEDINTANGALFNITVKSNQNDKNITNNNASFKMSLHLGMDLIYSIITDSTVAYLGEEYTYNVNILNKGPSAPTVFGTSITSNEIDKYEVVDYNSELGSAGRVSRRGPIVWMTVHDDAIVGIDDYGNPIEVYYGLYVGEDTNITFTIKPLTLGEITIKHYMQYPPSQINDLNGEDNEVTQIVTVHSITNLELSLETNKDELNPDDIITYTVTLKNTGDYIAENVKLNIVKPSILEAEEDYDYNIGDINVGETKTLTYKYKLTDYGVIDYNVTVLTDSKNTNTDNSKNIVLESLRHINILSLKVTSSTVDNPVIIRGTTNVNTGTVNLIIKNKKGENVLNDTVSISSNKGFSKTYNSLSLGTYTVEIITPTDYINRTFRISNPQPVIDNNEPVNTSNTINSTNITNNTNITTKLSINYNINNETTVIYGELKDENNNPIESSLILTIKDNILKTEKTYILETDTNGEYNLSLSLVSGTYSIEVKYNGNKTYTSSSNNMNIQITNISTNTNLNSDENMNMTYGEENNYTGVLKDKTGNLLIGYHIAVNITRLSNGASKIYYLTSDYLGRYNLPINLAPGDYTIESTINDLGFIGKSISNLTIKADKSKTQLITKDTLINYSTHGNFIGKLQDGENNPILGAHLDLTISNTYNQSKTYSVVTNYLGEFSLPINLAPGLYSVVSSFNGLNTYEPLIVKNTIIVE